MSYTGLLGSEPNAAPAAGLSARAQLEGQAAAQVQAALVAARAAQASLGQLGAAFELASKLGLVAAREELRAHIRAAVEPPRGFGASLARTAGISIGLGVIAGICTHFILVGLGQRHTAAAARRFAFQP